jgi:histidyl-tRNA synthetase
VKLDIPRGMRDLDAKEYSHINYIRNHFIRTASLFNFKMHQPSTLEMMSTLEAKGGSAISNEIYNFKDKGGRDIALRFDLTVGLTRHIARRRELKLPIKVAAFGGVWRYDEPQAGRYRHFHQWDVEIYDTYNLEHEAEIIQLVAHFFKELKLDVTIDINHRELLEQYIRKKLGLSDPHLSLEIFRAIDKVQKKGPQAVYEEYEQKIKPSILKPLLELSTVVGTIKEIEDQNLEISKLPRWKTICELVDSLSLRGVSNTRINLGIVRGLDYYSGIVFEILDPSTDIGALAGGGRYDTLTSAFNRRDIGAIGVAGGVERLLSALSHHGLIKTDNTPLVFVVSENKGLVFRIISELRCEGIPADYDSRGRPMRKQLEHAASIGATIVVKIEQEQGVSHTVKVKSLVSGLEMEGRIDQARTIVQDLLKTGG